jgi:hypothetical protein
MKANYLTSKPSPVAGVLAGFELLFYKGLNEL